MKKNKIFLGGTCNNSNWRNILIPKLTIEYFNPVVEDWTPECQIEEERQKNEVCNIHLYVITPRMKGCFSIAEAVESAIKIGTHCIFYVIETDDEKTFTSGELKSLKAVENMVKKYNAFVPKNMDEICDYIKTITSENN